MVNISVVNALERDRRGHGILDFGGSSNDDRKKWMDLRYILEVGITSLVMD